jgi:Tfp pilus assembly protein PilO
MKRIGGLTAAAAIVLIAVWYLSLFRPQQHELAAAHRRDAAAAQQASQLQQQVTSLQALEREIPADSARLKTVDAALPHTEDLQDVFSQLHQAATTSGVQLTTVSPSAPRFELGRIGGVDGRGHAAGRNEPDPYRYVRGHGDVHERPRPHVPDRSRRRSELQPVARRIHRHHLDHSNLLRRVGDMTTDATKSPTPAWQRTLMGVLLATLIVGLGYFLWTHELHHSAKASPPPAVVQPAPAPSSQRAATPSTTIPGGIPVSQRDPFSG